MESKKMIPIQFVPVNVTDLIHVFEKKGEIIILSELGEDITSSFDVRKEQRGQTEMVIVKLKNRMG